MTDVDGHIERTNERLHVIRKQLSSSSSLSYAEAALELLQWCEDSRAFRKEFEDNLLACLAAIQRACLQPAGFDELHLGFRVVAVCSQHREHFSPSNATQLKQWCDDLRRLLLLKNQEEQQQSPVNTALTSTATSADSASSSAEDRPNMEQIQHPPSRPWGQMPSHQFNVVTTQGGPDVNHHQMYASYPNGAMAAMYSGYGMSSGPMPSQNQASVGGARSGYLMPNGPLPIGHSHQMIGGGSGPYMSSAHYPNMGSQVKAVESDFHQHNVQNSAAAATYSTDSATAAAVLEQQQAQQSSMNQSAAGYMAGQQRFVGKATYGGPPVHMQRHSPYPNAYAHMINKRGAASSDVSLPPGSYFVSDGGTNGHGAAYSAGPPGTAATHLHIGNMNQSNIHGHWTPSNSTQVMTSGNYSPAGTVMMSQRNVSPATYHSNLPAGHHPMSGAHVGALPPSHPGMIPVSYSGVTLGGNYRLGSHAYNLSHAPTPPPNLPPQAYITNSNASVASVHPMHCGSTGGVANGAVTGLPVGSHVVAHPGLASSPSIQSVDTELRLTFNVRDGTVLAPFRLEHNLAVSNHAFNLKESVYSTLMSRQDLELQLKCFHHEDRNMTCNWPASVSVTVNNHPLSIERSGQDGRTHKALFIKALCHPGKNSVQISVTACCCSHLFLLQMVHRPSVRSVLHGLWRKRKLPAEHCIAKIKRLFGGNGTLSSASSPMSESLIEQNSVRMSLKCPISTRRISLPARGHECKHVQCFDLECYLRMNADRNTWRCPVCSKNAPLEGLEIDEYIFGILENADAATENVSIDANSRWSAISLGNGGLGSSTPGLSVGGNGCVLVTPKLEMKSEDNFFGECNNSVSSSSGVVGGPGSVGPPPASPYAISVGTPLLPPNTPDFPAVHTPGGSVSAVPHRPPSRPSSSTFMSYGAPRTPGGGPPSAPSTSSMYSAHGPGSVGPATPGGVTNSNVQQRPASAAPSSIASASSASALSMSSSNYAPTVLSPDDLNDLTLAALDSAELSDINAADLSDLPDMGMLGDPEELLSYLQPNDAVL